MTSGTPPTEVAGVRSTSVRPSPPDGRQLSANVASYVRDLIISGAVKAHAHLRTEHLAEQLGTSATPVREALLALQGEGFVRLEPNRGFRVVPLSRQDVLDLFDVQAYLAGELASRAAERLDRSLLAELEGLQERLDRAASLGDADEVEALNFAIHRVINTSAGATKLSWLLGTVVRYVPRRFFASIPGWQTASVEDHRAILQSLRTRNPRTARDSMRAHIRHAGDLLVAHLERCGLMEEALHDG